MVWTSLKSVGSFQGHLADLIGGAWDSRSEGCESEPQSEGKDYSLKNKIFKKQKKM